MTNDERAARMAAIAERAASAMPGPWRWRGNKHSHRIELLSLPGVGENSLLSVMAFWRWGTQSAMPIFRDAPQIMRKPTWVIPQPWNDWLIGGIDHPDARFIEHSREDIDFLLTEVGTLHAALALLVADDFDAWTADSDESHWQCHWCHAHGAAIGDEPRVRDHAETCPWLAARALVGHTVPTEEVEE